MLKIKIHQVLIIFILLFFVGCNYNRPVKSWKPVSEAEIKKFTVENKFELIVKKEIKSAFTVILVESPIEIGYYSLSNLNGKTMTLNSSKISKNSNLPLINEYVTVASNDTPEIPYVILVINDDELLKKAYKAAVKFNNGFEKNEFITNKGAIIPNEGKQIVHDEVYSITIFDKKGEVLLRN
jgi:hypothetical protein